MEHHFWIPVPFSVFIRQFLHVSYEEPKYSASPGLGHQLSDLGDFLTYHLHEA